MLILLPPSEGKSGPFRRGRTVGIESLYLPELTSARRKVCDALIACSGSADAADILGLGKASGDKLELNQTLLEQPTRPAGEVYTGVLYDALGLDSLSPTGKRRANAAIRVQSALWGPITIGNRIPPYRLSIGVTLPGIGGLAAFWREQLTGLLDDHAGPGVIIDGRSSGYAAAWRPQHTEKVVKVNAVTEKAGKRSVVSHFAKHTRGAVARLLLEAPRQPGTPEQVADIVAEHTRCELTGPDRTGWQLTVVTDPAGNLGS